MTKNQTYALLAGVATGAVVAFLYAPQSGVESRRQLWNGFAEAGDRLTEAGEYLRTQAGHFNTEAQTVIEHARTQVEDVLNQAETAVTSTLQQASKTFSVNVDQAAAAIASAVGSVTGHPPLS